MAANPGVRYQYVSPTSSAPGDVYKWVIGSWSGCSKTCAGRSVNCRITSISAINIFSAIDARPKPSFPLTDARGLFHSWVNPWRCTFEQECVLGEYSPHAYGLYLFAILSFFNVSVDRPTDQQLTASSL